MTDIKKAATPHGDVEYETKKCAGCEQEYLPEDTETVYWGEEVEFETTYGGSEFWKFNGRPNEIVMCENCIERPHKLILPEVRFWAFIGVLVGILLVLFAHMLVL